LLEHEGFKALDMVQRVSRDNGASLLTTRCPIRVDGQIYKSSRGAPRIGEHTDQLAQEYAL
jgi:crotonobetainyl-CoA:carnitine CoA-transferase CaiB-like acyl-CoA transferase